MSGSVKQNISAVLRFREEKKIYIVQIGKQLISLDSFYFVVCYFPFHCCTNFKCLVFLFPFSPLWLHIDNDEKMVLFIYSPIWKFRIRIYHTFLRARKTKGNTEVKDIRYPAEVMNERLINVLKLKSCI